MTPKEKAQQLTEKFWIYSAGNKDGSWKDAKQCAIICVDEILSLNINGNHTNWQNNPHHYYSKEYWQQVKQEIINL